MQFFIEPLIHVRDGDLTARIKGERLITHKKSIVNALYLCICLFSKKVGTGHDMYNIGRLCGAHSVYPLDHRRRSLPGYV